MLRRIREPFGKAGLIVAVVALVAALVGGAYAASGGLTGKQKKEVKKIAAQYAGKDGAQGPAGQAGPQGPKGDAGPAGANGEDGATGATGKNGTNGKDGKSVSVFPLAPSNGEGFCEETGGAKFTNGTETAAACNGKPGKSGTTGSGEMMAGYWLVEGEKGFTFGPEWTITTISFPLPLKAAPTETILIKPSGNTEEEKAECPGTLEEPEAAATGVLCLYSLLQAVTLENSAPSTFGAVLAFSEASATYGSWAVKTE